MDIVKSLSSRRENYDYLHRLDDKLSPFLKAGIRLACILSYYSGLSLVLKFIVSKLLRQKKIANEKVIMFVFSRNQDLIRKQLGELGLNYPIYDLTFERAVKDSPLKIERFSSISLILAALANAKLFLTALKDYKEDVVVQNNQLKVFKLSGYKLFYELLTEDCKVVIKFNDHIFNSLLLHEVCVNKGIKTVYIQHAPVSPRFPPLHHDLNVLFSQDSKEKYRTLDMPKEVFEFMDIRLLVSEKYKSAKLDGKGSILIAVNILDDLDKVMNLVDSLVEDFKIIIRPHPREQRDLKRFKSKTSLSQGRTIWEDMNLCEIVLCNESAVPLEAIFYDRRYYKTAMISDSLDSYGFLKKGLITKEFNDTDSLVYAIKEGEVCVDKGKLDYYIGDYENYRELAKALKGKIESLVS